MQQGHDLDFLSGLAEDEVVTLAFRGPNQARIALPFSAT